MEPRIIAGAMGLSKYQGRGPVLSPSLLYIPATPAVGHATHSVTSSSSRSAILMIPIESLEEHFIPAEQFVHPAVHMVPANALPPDSVGN